MLKRGRTRTKLRWINTRLIYDFAGNLIHREGFWHYGPILEAGGPPTIEHTDWAFFSDGTEAGSVIIGTKNTNPAKGDIPNDTVIFYRAGMEETAGNAAMNFTCQLQYNRNSAGFLDVNGSSTHVQSVATANIADGADTTQRMTAFTYDSTNEGFDEVDGLAGGNTADLLSNGFEALFSFQLIASALSDGDTIVFKVVDSAGADLDVYNQTDPTITVEIAAGAPGPSVGSLSLMGHGL